MFDEIRFPEDISYGSKGGPGYNTSIVETEGGAEQRVSRWSAARRRYDVKYGIKGPDDVYRVYQFFLARMGPANGFRYKDWADYNSTNKGRNADMGGADPTNADQNIGTGDGAATVFQLRKAYTSGPSTVYRNITKPVSGTVKIAKNGVDLSTGWSVDLTSGIVTFTSPPATEAVLTAGYEFDTPARFDKATDADCLQAALSDWGIRDIDSIPLVELTDAGAVPTAVVTGGAVEICPTAPTPLSQAQGRVWIFDTTNGTQTATLPDPATVPPGGPIFYILNLGPNDLVVKRADASTLLTIPSGEGAEILLSVASDNTTRVWYAI